MKAYVATTGVVFSLLTVVHVLRAFQETNLARDPWYIAITLLALAFAVWAASVFKAMRAPTQ